MQTPQDSVLPSPLPQESLASPLVRQALASPLQQHALASPFQQHALASPLQQHALASPLQQHALASPLESPLRMTFSAEQQVLAHAADGAPAATAIAVHHQQMPVHPAAAPSTSATQGEEVFRKIFTMSFATQEDGFDACQNLARKCGFGVRRRTSKTTTVYIVCSREGRPEPKKDGVRKRNRISERCNCDWRVVMFQTPKKTWEFRVGKCMTHNHMLNYEDFRYIDPRPRHELTHSTPVFAGGPQFDRMLMTPPMSPTVMTGVPLTNLPDVQRALPPFATLLQQPALPQPLQMPHFIYSQGGYPHMALYSTQGGQEAGSLVGLGIMHPNVAVAVTARQQEQSPPAKSEPV